MNLIKVENYEITVSDEALLVGPIRKLWKQDRSKGKEAFLKQMSVLYFVYSPCSNYFYISDEKERLKEVLDQEGITDFSMSPEFKEAVEAYKKVNHLPEIQLLEDVYSFLEKSRKTLRDIDYDSLDDAKDKLNAMKSGMGIVSLIPKLMTDLKSARDAVNKELQDQGKNRGSQELNVGDQGLI